MAEYIDREEYCREHCSFDNEFCGKESCPLWEVPAADVVPVVRCDDCKHLCLWNQKDMYAFCPKTNIAFLPFEKDTRIFFCGFGERKEKVYES